MGIIAKNKNLASELKHYARLCYERHLVGAAGGNLSVRVPGENVFLVTASGIALRDVAMENIVAVDADGNVLESHANLNPSKEISFHLAIYKVRHEANAVIHIHPVFATVYATAKKQIPLVTVSANLKLRQCSVVPEAHPGSQELCRNIIQTLMEGPEDAKVLLLERHGIVTYGTTLCDAFDNAELAEDTAKIAFLCSGFKARELPGVEGMKVIDLTSPLDERIQCYLTDPPFKKTWHVDFKSAGVYVSKLEMGAHAGTHVDAPLHYVKDSNDIAAMALEGFFGEAIAIDVPKRPGEDITPADFCNSDIREGDIVLFHTGWEERASSSRFFEGDWPGFESEAIDSLIAKKVKAIGGDIASADSPKSIREGAMIHKKVLGAGIPIFEALINMKQVVGRRFFFVGLPLRLVGGEASPIRAIAIINK